MIETTHLSRNAGRCMECGDVIESKFRHDFQTCSCGTCFIDGGLAYSRWGESKPGSFESLCVYDTPTPEETPPDLGYAHMIQFLRVGGKAVFYKRSLDATFKRELAIWRDGVWVKTLTRDRAISDLDAIQMVRRLANAQD